MLGLTSLASILVAASIAALLGALLGRLATQWFSGMGFSNRLTEVRGAFLPFILCPLLSETTEFSAWLVIGIVVGFMQAVAVGRWIARRTGEWSPAILGGVALGISRAALISARATARGAVISTLALTAMHVILLEALLAALALPGLNVDGSIGALLLGGGGAETLFPLALGTGAVVATELGSSWLFQRRLGGSKS